MKTNKSFMVKPFQGIILNYFSLYLNHMPTTKSIWESMSNIIKHGEAGFALFYTFGTFDITLLGISDNWNTLYEMRRAEAYQKVEGVMDYFIHYGIVLSAYPEEFDFNKAISENSIMGIVTVKIRTDVWSKRLKNIKDVVELRKILKIIIERLIEETKEQIPIDSKRYRAILVESFESEDLSIIFLTESMQFVKLFSTKIRALELKDIMPKLPLEEAKIRHIIVSTTTIFGININKEFKKIFPQKNNYDKLKWITMFQVRPGHLQNAIDSILELSKKDKSNLEANPIAGRNDLIVYPKKNAETTITKFLNAHLSLTDGLVDNFSFLTSETYISFPQLHKVETEERPSNLYPPLSIKKEIQELIDDIKNDENLYILERETFIQMVRKFGYLLENRYLQDSFSSISPLIFRGIREYQKLKIKRFDESLLLDIWSGLVELCISTRYKGLPPIGETAVSSTLGFYSTGQKLLVLLDLLGNKMLKTIAENYNDFTIDPMYIATINTNVPSPTTVPVFATGTAFIMLPSIPLSHSEFLIISFFHEIGHVLFKSFKMQLNFENNKIFKTFQELEEPFADFFVIKTIFDLKWEDYKESIKDMLLNLNFESITSEALYNEKMGNINKAKDLYDTIYKTLDRLPHSKKIKNLFHSISRLDILEVKILDTIKSIINAKNYQKVWDLWMYLYSQADSCFYSVKR